MKAHLTDPDLIVDSVIASFSFPKDESNIKMEKIIRDILLLLFYSFISYLMITGIVFLTAVVFHLHFSFGISFVIWLIMVFVSGVE